MSTVKRRQDKASVKNVPKAEEVLDAVLKDGRVTAYPEFESSVKSYQLERATYDDMNLEEKVEMAKDFYNSVHDMEYEKEEVIKLLDGMINEPESVKSDQPVRGSRIGRALEDESLEEKEDFEVLESEDKVSYRTGRAPGGPEMRQVIREFYPEDSEEYAIRFIGTEKAEEPLR